MEKLDYKVKYHDLYTATATAVKELDVPPMNFAMVDGRGSPEGPEALPEFQNAISALYSITFTLKMGRKKAHVEPDYTIAPLEGLWWMADGLDFDAARPADWRWTLMILQPEFIDRAEFEQAVAGLLRKKANPALEQVELVTTQEGRVVQILHVGPYDTEGPTIGKLEDYCASRSLRLVGKHHEIYLGDPRRAKPEKLRTILRHPVTVRG